jgi:hypothetical protein
MSPREVEVTSLKGEHGDLHDKLKVVPLKHLSSTSAAVTLDDLRRGLASSSAHEFFARCFARKQPFKALRDNLGDQDVQASIIGLGEDPEALIKALEKNLGGTHPVRVGRFAQVLAGDTGQALFKQLVASGSGAEAARNLYSTPLGWAIMSKVGAGVMGEEAETHLIRAKAEGSSVKDKESVRQLMPLAHAVNTHHLEADGGLKDDAGITSLLNSEDQETRYGTISEFFSSDKKLERFFEYIGIEANRELVTRRLKENLPSTALAFFDVLKTGREEDGGIRRLAKAITHEDGNKVIRALAQDLGTQEVIYTLFNAYEDSAGGRELLGKRVMLHALASEDKARVVQVQKDVTVSRLKAAGKFQIMPQRVITGFGDIPMPEGVLDEIRMSRQAVS